MGYYQPTVQATLDTEPAEWNATYTIHPGVYVNYGVGLFDAASRIRLQYFLSRMWTVQAETADETSGDIFYTVER